MIDQLGAEGPRVPVLDHGYVQLIEGWGSDARIVETARMSTGKGFVGWEEGPCPWCDGAGHVIDTESDESTVCLICGGKGKHRGDARLLRHLWENHHDSPFEFGGLIIEVQAPLMVFREWHRHRTQSYSERSARYAPLPNFNYLPTVDRVMLNGLTRNKQAGAVKGSEPLTEEFAAEGIQLLDAYYKQGEELYQHLLRGGWPKELARLPLTVGRYSTMRAQAVLRNWLAFLTLRLPPNAQWEIRQYAQQVETAVASRFPRTHTLFRERLPGD